METLDTPKRARRKAPKNWQANFLRYLRKYGNVTFSARKAGVSRVFVYRKQKLDPTFAAKWDDAIAASCDVLEQEAWRRAVKGVKNTKTYTKGSYVIEEEETKYSDTLLIFLLKGNNPEKFRENINMRADVNANVNHSGSVNFYIPANGREAEGSDQDGS